jgi:FkbM family methyltransferase
MFQAIIKQLFLNEYKPDLILDIGAHHGDWTQQCLSIYPEANYILFEPNPYYELTKFTNLKNIKIINEILNEKECIVNWYCIRGTGDSINKELSFHYENIIPTERNSYPLDYFCDHITGNNILMKIDCQGAEIPILKGSSKLYNKIDFIILEIPLFGKYNENTSNFLGHITFMDEIGFIPFSFLDNHNVNNFNMQVDLMFINKNHYFNTVVQERLPIKDFDINKQF